MKNKKNFENRKIKRENLILNLFSCVCVSPTEALLIIVIITIIIYRLCFDYWILIYFVAESWFYLNFSKKKRFFFIIKKINFYWKKLSLITIFLCLWCNKMNTGEKSGEFRGIWGGRVVFNFYQLTIIKSFPFIIFFS